MVFVVDLRTFRTGEHPGSVCHLIGGGPVSPGLVREMAKDAFLKVVFHDGVNIHTVTHIGRRRPPDRRIAGQQLPPPSPADATLTAVLRIDTTTLARTLPGPFIDVPGAGILDDTKTRSLLGDLTDVMAEKGVNVQHVVFDTRRWPNEIRVAGLEEQPYCYDCGTPYGLEDDHNTPSALDGTTTLANLRRRCRSDHKTKTRREATRTIKAGRLKARARRAAAAAAAKANTA